MLSCAVGRSQNIYRMLTSRTARQSVCVINLWGLLTGLAYPQAHPQLLSPQLLVHTLKVGKNLGIDSEPAYTLCLAKLYIDL